jgi:arylsulfatase A-like enzyme
MRAASLILSLLLIPCSLLPAAGQTNIIFILADDLGYTDVACYGSKYYETPNIDRMAAQGMRFSDGHSCGPNCQPSRAALISGQYMPRTGVYTVGGIERFDWHSRPLRPVANVVSLPLDKITIAQSLKAAGYATAMFGKWHLGEDAQHHPGKRGFDEAIVSMGKHFDFNTNPHAEVPKGQYLADFLTDKAVDFIKRNKDKPFFLYLPHFGVHSPHDAKKDIIAKFKDKPAVGGHKSPVYAAMIASVDESVGRVLSTLDELKLAENTLVIFSSDNGGVGGYEREGIKQSGDITDNTPLRSGKGSLYEGGHRVPYVFIWPGKIKPGIVCETPICGVDLYPTLLEVSGAKAPEKYPLDGASYAGLLSDEGRGTLKRDAIFWHFPGYLGAGTDSWRTTPVSVVREGDFKLMEFMEDKHLELYNLREDLGETKNLAVTMPEKAKTLQEKLHAWQTEIKAPMPTPNTPTKASDSSGKKKKAKKKTE